MTNALGVVAEWRVGVNCPPENDMESSRFVAIFLPLFAAVVSTSVTTFLLLFVVFDQSERRRKEARDKRLVEHRMNAKLLRLDI
jgi:hypothetical protein